MAWRKAEERFIEGRSGGGGSVWLFWPLGVWNGADTTKKVILGTAGKSL